MNASTIELRILGAADAEAYWNFRLESLERDPQAFGASAEEHRKLSLQDAVERLTNDPANNFVVGAFEGERLLGTAGFVRERGIKSRHKGRIWGVYVRREARGNGTARRMFRMALERATHIEGIEQIMISVVATQEAAVRLYRSLGFEPYGIERRALKVNGNYLDEEHMVLFLNRSA